MAAAQLRCTHGGLEEVLGVVVEEVERRQHGQADDHSPEEVLLVGGVRLGDVLPTVEARLVGVK